MMKIKLLCARELVLLLLVWYNNDNGIRCFRTRPRRMGRRQGPSDLLEEKHRSSSCIVVIDSGFCQEE